jgi:glutathione S-transferase
MVCPCFSFNRSFTTSVVFPAEATLRILLIEPPAIHESSPFFIKPITKFIVSQVESKLLTEQTDNQLSFLESQVKTAPDGGPYLCGSQLTAADMLLSFPILSAIERGVVSRDKYPAIHAYAEHLKGVDTYKRAIAKIEELDGKYAISL